MLRRTATGILTIVAVIAVIALVVGQLTGQPVLLGYATSGSMAPTLETGDGFLAVPASLSGEVESGDGSPRGPTDTAATLVRRPSLGGSAQG